MAISQDGSLAPCPECRVLPGQQHRKGCRIELCPYCGGSMEGCLLRGCKRGKEDGLDWPPTEDRRVRWTGVSPVLTACKKSGFFLRKDFDGECVECGRTHPDAVEDQERISELEWDRQRQMFVRTNLTEAFSRMRRMNLYCRCGLYERGETDSVVSTEARDALADRKEVAGYAYYTSKGAAKKRQGRDFKLFYGQCDNKEGKLIGLPLPEIGEIVEDCLSLYGVIFDRPRLGRILVKTASIKALE